MLIVFQHINYLSYILILPIVAYVSSKDVPVVLYLSSNHELSHMQRPFLVVGQGLLGFAKKHIAMGGTLNTTYKPTIGREERE